MEGWLSIPWVVDVFFVLWLDWRLVRIFNLIFNLNSKQSLIWPELRIKNWSPSYAKLRINLIPLQYPPRVIFCEDNYKWAHWSWSVRVPTLDFKIKLYKINDNSHNMFDLRLKGSQPVIKVPEKTSLFAISIVIFCLDDRISSNVF